MINDIVFSGENCRVEQLGVNSIHNTMKGMTFDGNHMLGNYSSPQPGEFTPQPLMDIGNSSYTLDGQLVGTINI